jgi:hypothetical protein
VLGVVKHQAVEPSRMEEHVWAAALGDSQGAGVAAGSKQRVTEFTGAVRRSAGFDASVVALELGAGRASRV